MLDAICFKQYGKTSDTIVEQVLAANQDLAELGLTYPAGTQIYLPVIADLDAPAVVSLWNL